MKRGAHEHPKVSALMERLGLPLYAATGLLEMLWHYAAKFTPAGDIGRWSDAQIARFVGWDREPAELVAALADAGWLDAHAEHRLVVHDWAEHADDAVHMALARARKHFADGTVPRLVRLPKDEKERAEAHYAAASAQKGKRGRTSTRAHAVRTESTQRALDEHTESTRRGAALPCLALPSPTLPAEHTPRAARRGKVSVDAPYSAGFLRFWTAYPAKLGKGAAWTAWQQRDCEPLTDGIVSAVTRYAATEKWRKDGGQFIPNPATWLNRRSWEDEPGARPSASPPRRDLPDVTGLGAQLLAGMRVS